MSKLNLEKVTKPELSVDEFNALFEGFKELANSELETIKSLKDGESFSTKLPLKYYKTETLESDCLMSESADGMIEMLLAFKKECEQYENKRGFYVEQRHDISGDYEGSYAELDAFYLQAEWEVPIEEVTENMINSEFRNHVMYWLAPEGIERYDIRSVDCKMLALFREGKIDWGTLRTLTYSDCDL
jgi:hypothetical protein